MTSSNASIAPTAVPSLLTMKNTGLGYLRYIVISCRTGNLDEK